MLSLYGMFEVGLCKEKCAKKIKDYVYMKEKQILENVCVKEKGEINWLKESKNSIYPILLLTTNDVFSVQSKECSEIITDKLAQ